MRVEGIHASDILAHTTYLEQAGLQNLFSADALDDNRGQRHGVENGYRAQDLQWMLDKIEATQNKYYILRLLRRGDLTQLLSFLNKEQLVAAMGMFPRQRLIRFLLLMPKPLLLKILLQQIPLKRLIKSFPPEVLHKLLNTKRLELRDLVAALGNIKDPQMRQETMALLFEAITGKPPGKLQPHEMMAMFMQLPKEQFIEGIKRLPPKHLVEYMTALTQKHPDLLLMIPKPEFLYLLEAMPKSELLDLFRLIPDDLLIECVSQLPSKYLALAASQLDNTLFSQLMAQQYPNLIASLAESA